MKEIAYVMHGFSHSTINYGTCLIKLNFGIHILMIMIIKSYFLFLKNVEQLFSIVLNITWMFIEYTSKKRNRKCFINLLCLKLC